MLTSIATVPLVRRQWPFLWVRHLLKGDTSRAGKGAEAGLLDCAFTIVSLDVLATNAQADSYRLGRSQPKRAEVAHGPARCRKGGSKQQRRA